MCGIVGVVGRADGLPRFYDGLKRLEYRGYDSAGTAYHAGLLGRAWMEGLARVPVDVDLSSEFRYR
ncbi:MAG: hypothetical protein OWV35_12630, partial [Firmicutes bacterium]|nr:hypothetical protein [Bacillota bacterium]